jgi:DNA-directed RNA polymerase subunit RPC12/RpoP
MSEKKTTDGDMSNCECPECGKIIRDIWDYSPNEGSEIECPHCEKTLIFTRVETICEVSLSAK